MLTRLTKAVGVKGIYLSLCKKAKCVPWSVDVPIFGRVATLHEILNIHDNFAAGELRDDYIESFLRNSVHPVIVYCGVNTGVTIRWWLHINHNAMIYGIDMMQEAHDLTISRLGGGGEYRNYTGITAPLTDLDGDELTIKFSDPLDGENRIDNNISSNAFCRKLITARIDTLLNPYGIKSIDLLKIDIEGSAAKALRGAPKMLSITKNVVLEYHSEAELGDSVNLLVANGFHLRRFRNRNLWFRRA